MPDKLSYITLRFQDESFDDYFVRLFEHKAEYGLNCEQIAELLNAESPDGVQRGESAWRKAYKQFNHGRIYERSKMERGVTTRILCVSDLHVPFQKPVETFSEYAHGRVDILVINGDVCDFSAISKFPKAYRSSPMDEMVAARQYLIDLIDYIHPKRVVITYGNHDARFQQYLAKSLDVDILQLMPETELDLICDDGFRKYNSALRTNVYYDPLTEVFADDGISIEYAHNWYAQIGKVLFCHPMTFMSGIMKTAEKAVTFFRNEGIIFDTLVMGHTHRTGDYTLGGTIMYEQGACCDTDKMRYSNGKLTLGQREGFLYLCLDSTGSVVREQSKIIHLN